MKFENRNILIISNEPWGDVWYSKHNWAFELSKKNSVIFVNPPSKWGITNILENKISTFEYLPNIKILNYQNILPYTRFSFFYRINNFLISRKLRKWLQKNDFRDYIIWTFDPFRLTNPKLLSPLFSIYHIADKYRIKKENELLKNVDYIFTISKTLINKPSIKKALILSHGISESEFEADEDIEIEQGYILYVGTIEWRVDHKLVKEMLQKFPNEHFVFIGKIYENYSNETFREIFIHKQYQNLTYIPPIHYKKLKNYISKAKICLAPMSLNINGNNINHHKLNQYLAQGKPVICPPFIDYQNNNLMYVYNSHEEAILLIKELLYKKENPQIIEDRILHAKSLLYENLIRKVENYLTELSEIKTL